MMVLGENSRTVVKAVKQRLQEIQKSLPAGVMAKNLLDWKWVAWMAIATVIILILSRWFFRLALRRYRSASS